ncbi:CBS domain-containing protein [Actinokineospora auranticolor]|uniref:CBS domain-containing protein n=1 Tax=Actinokineospora auranticolor TaxID=155976 RepID=A0A2S6GIV0_9PSEU|nr:CBS domain-containing protein [Actinokineospora auranticolor]PPK65168.1 CBS domain-containing protein [Actinokineospora auranticolor]
MLASEIMDAGAVAVRPDTPLRAVREVLRAARDGAVAVVADDRVVGMVSSGDLLREQVRSIPRAATAADVMDPVRPITSTAHCGDVARLLLGTGHQALPVVDGDGGLAGVIGLSDLLDALETRDDVLAVRVCKLVADNVQPCALDCAVTDGNAVVTGEFRSGREERVVRALASSVPGVRTARTRPAPGPRD